MKEYKDGKSIFTVTMLALAVTGCFGGSSSSSSNDTDTPEGPDSPSLSETMTPTTELEGEQTGSLQDAPVEGMSYWTASHEERNQTNAEGEFTFEPGEVVAFYLGDQRILATDAELITTPMDTVSKRRVAGPNATSHPHEPINIMRVLQGLDASDSDATITVPQVLQDTSLFLPDGETLDLGRDSDGLPDRSEIIELMIYADANELDIPSFDEANEHYVETVENLEGKAVDLRGEWQIESFWIEENFQGGYFDGCEPQSTSTLVIGEESVVQVGDELNRDGDTCELDPFVADNESSDWIREGEHNGETGVAWDFADAGLIDLECGAACDLGQLRTTVTDWDAVCMHDDYPNHGSADSSEYCDESDSHNKYVKGYSEVMYVDRLGGDRILRLKRDFSASMSDQAVVDNWPLEASDYSEQGASGMLWTRAETQDYALDMEEGTWVETSIANDAASAETIEGINIVHGQDSAASHQPSCEDAGACTWEELNESHENVDFVYVRGTETVNWVTDEAVGTLKRQQ